MALLLFPVVQFGILPRSTVDEPARTMSPMIAREIFGGSSGRERQPRNPPCRLDRTIITLRSCIVEKPSYLVA
jgi:hypothetical protein